MNALSLALSLTLSHTHNKHTHKHCREAEKQKSLKQVDNVILSRVWGRAVVLPVDGIAQVILALSCSLSRTALYPTGMEDSL